MKRLVEFALLLSLACCAASHAMAQNAENPSSVSDLPPGSSQLISPEEMVKALQFPQAKKPLVLNVGPIRLFQQARIPGAEYIGPASDQDGLEKLRTRVKSLPHDTFIVLYCGCCPWDHCPNVRPAYNELHTLGFSQVKVLYIANNLGTDWVEKGYPTVKGLQR